MKKDIEKRLKQLIGMSGNEELEEQENNPAGSADEEVNRKVEEEREYKKKRLKMRKPAPPTLTEIEAQDEEMTPPQDVNKLGI